MVIKRRSCEIILQVEELDSLLPAPEYPSLTVVPKPGLCVKTKNDKGIKFFVNICKLSEVPALFNRGPDVNLNAFSSGASPTTYGGKGAGEDDS